MLVLSNSHDSNFGRKDYLINEIRSAENGGLGFLPCCYIHKLLILEAACGSFAILSFTSPEMSPAENYCRKLLEILR